MFRMTSGKISVIQKQWIRIRKMCGNRRAAMAGKAKKASFGLRPAGGEAVRKGTAFLAEGTANHNLRPGVIMEQRGGRCARTGGNEVRGWPGPDHWALWTSVRGSDFFPNMPLGIPRTGPRTRQLLGKYLLKVGRQTTDLALPLELQGLRICPWRPQGAGNSGLRVPSGGNWNSVKLHGTA